MAYFDDLNEEIRFRYGQLSDGTGKSNIGNFVDDYRNNGLDSTNNLDRARYNISHVQVIADSAGTATLGQAGEYVAIDVVQNETNNGDIVVLVWYDGYSGDLMYAYNSNPTAGTTGKNKTNWTGVKTIFTGAGEYAQIVADANGGIHIAGYDGTNGDLKYAYLSKYNADYDEETNSCTVDSYAILGQNLTIDVVLADDGVTPIPYIGYYALSSTKPKLAYRVSGTANNGAEEDMYTGNWETTIIPSPSRVPQDRINVALWKNTTTGNVGKKKASNTGTNTAGQYYGNCFGNGTSNPVLGYQTRESSTKGYIETAQMK